MKARTIVTVALLAFVAASVAVAVLRESRGRGGEPLVEPDGFVVYYCLVYIFGVFEITWHGCRGRGFP